MCSTDKMPPLRTSLFPSIPPFLNYLPVEGAELPKHRDEMVEIRESLWRVPQALVEMVAGEEAEKIHKSGKERSDRAGNSTLIFPSAFDKNCKEKPPEIQQVVLRNKNKQVNEMDKRASLVFSQCSNAASLFAGSMYTAALFELLEKEEAEKEEKERLRRLEEPFIETEPEITPSPINILKTDTKPEVLVIDKTSILCSQRSDDATLFSNEHEGARTSQFPACHQISRKDFLSQNYQIMLDKFGGDHFNFLPTSMILPQDRTKLQDTMNLEGPHTFWIVKPPGRNNGSGIVVINHPEQIPDHDEETLVMKYVKNPFLIDGRKFDLRVYVLVTSVDPLRVYIYDDGLVRFATEPYTNDPDLITDARVHITNYDINKGSDKFVYNDNPEEPIGDKWTLSGLWKYLSDHPLPKNVSLFTMWSQIEDLVIKSILVGLSSIRQEFHQRVKSSYNCYKMFGYDILLDSGLKPHLMEVNSRPAALSDKLDAAVNRPMVSEMFHLVGYHIPRLAVTTSTRRSIVLNKFNLPHISSQHISFDSRVYSCLLSNSDIQKQSQFPRNQKDRKSYLPAILKELTGADVKILVKTLDEFSQLKKFSRIFPRKNSNKYFEFFDELPYYDKLLDAFEDRFGENRDEGIEFVRQYCERNVHL